jgi:type VI secretion system protein ImpJ
MSELSKVVWAEGVFLGQQHFQMWDRQLNSRMHFALKAHIPFYWGVVSVAWSDVALREGRFELQKLQCIMPNGLAVSFDRDQNGPLFVDLTAIDRHEVVLSLAIPLSDLVEGVAGYQSQGRIGGWIAQFDKLSDDLDATRIREVMTAKPNLLLRTDADPDDQTQCLRLVKIQRQRSGNFAVVDDMLPPCLSIDAMSTLKDLAQSVVDMLVNLVRDFTKNRMKIGDISSYSTIEMADFLFQKELVTLLPEFRQFIHHTLLHPYIFYKSLIKLHQIIATYLQPEAIDRVVEYDHNSLESCVFVLVNEIKDMLSLKKERPESQIQLSEVAPGRMETTSIPRHALENFSFYLAVDAKQDSVDWVGRFTNMTKLASLEQLDTMIASGIPGVPMKHIQRLPQKIRIKSGYEYFQIQTDHELWRYVLQSQKFGLFCMGEFSDASVELIVLEEK